MLAALGADRAATAALSCLALLAVAVPIRAADEEYSVVLEPAPSDLGGFVTESMVLMDSRNDGEQLVFLDGSTGKVHMFLETGKRWRDPVQLYDERGSPFSMGAPASMSVEGAELALAGMRDSYLFELRNGATEAHSAKLIFASDVTRVPFGWVVGLLNMPSRSGKILGRETFEDSIPRLVLLNDDLELKRAGLYETDLPESASIGTARRLKVAWDGLWMYAAELGNYQIYALDGDFKLKATYRDPELILEKGVDAVRNKDVEAIEEKFRETAESQGKNLVSPVKRSTEKDRLASSAKMFSYEAVIRDIAWDFRGHRLLVLIAAGIGESFASLDILDPAIGEVRRVSLRFPPGSETTKFAQVVVGHDYLWFRSLAGGQPTYRLDRTQLFEKGESLMVPEFSLLDVEAEAN